MEPQDRKEPEGEPRMETLAAKQSPGRLFAEVFETAPDAEEGGVPTTVLDSQPPVVFWLRSTQSRTVRRVRNRIIAENRQRWRARRFDLTPEEEDAIDVKLLAEAIVVKWVNMPDVVNDRPDSELAYSVENARKLFSDPRFRQFRQEVMELAGANETYRKAALRELAGN